MVDQSLIPDSLARLAPPEIAASLAEPYPLSESQIATYQANGYVKLEQVLTGEALGYYRHLIGFAVGHLFGADERALADKRVYEQSFLQAFNLWPRFPAIREFVHSYRFADIARRLIAARDVRLWFDQALFKEPGGRLTDYHQDAGFWPVHPADQTVTLWLALVDVPRERGCMAFAEGSHRLAADTEFIDIFSAKGEIELGANVQPFDWTWVPMAGGDCTFHSGKVYHRAGANKTAQMREAMTVAYMTADAVYDWPKSNPSADRHQFVTEGMQRGDEFDHPLTPQLT